MGKVRGGMFILYLAAALYVANSAFEFVVLPNFVAEINQWIMTLIAILLFVGGLRYLKSHRKTKAPKEK